MKIVFDTTFLVELDRKNKNAIALAERLTELNHELWISIITVSEIISGAYLRQDFKKSLENARMALAQFDWQEMNAGIAFKTGEMLAFQISQGKQIDYQDSVIAATALELNAEFIVTENTAHFNIFPKLQNKVITINQLQKKLK